MTVGTLVRRRRPLGILVALALMVTLSGCSNDEEVPEAGTVAVHNPEPEPFFPELESVPMSAEQQAALADGIVTEEEYLAGFDRYRACVRDRGFDLELVERRGPFMSYAHSEEARPDADECFWREYQELDTSWQLGHQEDTEQFAAVNYCLEVEGHATGSTMAEAENLLAEAGITFPDCIDRWVADGMSWYG